VQEWLSVQRARGEPAPLAVERGATRLTFALHAATDDDDQWLVVLRETSDAAVIEAMSLSFRLTARESEVLYWVVKGKTNRDIGDILSLSPRTVTKHLEHVFQKLGVETRTAAAGLAISRVRQLG
jgi:DNA-binding CsgD family transcriptional regulator